ncbi:MAG: MFS transporter [Proteobacteria bacterium]|nr:MFS transporter [Pseudomonadota bacterium]
MRFTAGGWPAIVLTYFFGALSSASLSKLIPLQTDYAQHLGVTPASFGLLLAALTLAPALFASVGGSLCDRFGSRATLISAALCGAVINGLYLWAESLPAFYALRVLEGCILIGAYSAAPALIMATTSGRKRGQAMAFWSTYTPVGISAGLLLSSEFAGTTQWRGGYALHCGLFAALAIAGLLLPDRPSQTTTTARPATAGLFEAWRQRGPLRIAVCFGLLVVMGFGVSTVFPTWYAHQQGITIGHASSLLATTNLIMVLGGVLTAFALSRGIAPLRLLTGLSVLGIVAGSALFWPGTPQALGLVALGLWLLGSGASTAAITSSLPLVLSDPSRGAAAAGLLSQIAALSTFFTPQLWLTLAAAGAWQGFIAVIAICWLLTLWVFPVRQHD